ncbi:MAG: PIN domain nuclease [Flavobacteriales bacterium]|nr:PIN domain nuclease [Flavobacteriales bacterium]|tara:strand:+ start:2240 stop:2668 length:429 start_codon:yes stop_codon:yes gene_type:complete
MKSTLYLDTNILLDYLLKRAPFHKEVAQIISISLKNENISIWASSHGFATAYYFIKKFSSHEIAIEKLRLLRSMISISDVDQGNIDMSLYSNFPDFEDAVQYFSALSVGADFIISRNIKDFKKSDINCLTPTEYLKIYENQS